MSIIFCVLNREIVRIYYIHSIYLFNLSIFICYSYINSVVNS
nr:MAG TPA: hypothetical protein [Caudoviricetes sp.]